MEKELENLALKNFEIEKAEKDHFGFWVYLMTDLLSFAAVFAAFAVLRNNTFGGPSGRELFSLPFVLIETFILLTSSFTCGLAMLAAQDGDKKKVITWFSTTFILGASFLVMEFTEFHKLIVEGNGPQRSGFLTSFFALVGLHGLHIFIGLLWMFIAMVMTQKRGLTIKSKSNLTRLSLFWHFLDIVWIFIFTIVYLMGVM
ncbi:MAG: cyoC [Candidatus Doudnabacteria bacterium]|nr:cyoC [Candidatus Doudnabacteria bacterium]